MTDRPFVIVIDDDPSVCKAVRRLLRIAQMDVETYSSAENFLLAVLARTPDCLVLDVRMPGITGPELRDQMHDAGRHTPIVFITAHDEEVPPGRGSGAGTAEVLLKPFGDEALLGAIGRAIRRSYGGPDDAPVLST
jgi:FixJ family two-component response regulator